MSAADIDVVKWLKRINGKFQNPFGITIWATDAAGNQVQVLCLPNGTLLVNGVVAILGPVDVSDRAARLLGIIYGSQGAQLLQRAVTFDTLVQLRNAGVEIDPRNIRPLTIADQISVQPIPGATWDVSDRAARLLGIIYGSQAQQLQQRAATFELLVQLTSAGVQIDPRDVSDRAARLLGIVYGSLTQLQQRAATFDLYVQLRNAGVEIDPRQIRALTVADQVAVQPIGGSTWDVSDRAARLLGRIYGSQGSQLLQRAATFELLVQLTNAGVQIDPRDISDRAARLLGIVYGSQSQQLLQRAATFDLLVQLRSGGVEIDPRYIINDMAAGQSTTANLAGGATYTSASMSGDGYRRITGSVTADVAGTLYVEQSPDNANWDVSDPIVVAAGATLGYCVEVVCPYLRIRYVNDANPQTTFRLYSFLRTI
jgi:hypothetical protein